MKKASSKRPARRAARPAAKASKAATSLVDIKNLVGQMKGMLTWMSKERAELQKMIERGRELLYKLEPPSDEHVLDALKAAAGEDPAPGFLDGEGHHDEAGPYKEEHGDPALSGVSSESYDE